MYRTAVSEHYYAALKEGLQSKPQNIHKRFTKNKPFAGRLATVNAGSIRAARARDGNIHMTLDNNRVPPREKIRTEVSFR